MNRTPISSTSARFLLRRSVLAKAQPEPYRTIHPTPPPAEDPDAPSGGDQENDARYARPETLPIAFEARSQFIQEISHGPLRMDLLRVALQISAEDDALATNSTVALPVDSYYQRIENMADEISRLRLPDAGLTPSTSTPEAVEAVVKSYLFEERKIRVKLGRTGIPKDSIVDSPGVWERAFYAYVDKTLTSRWGSPASLAIIMQHIWRRLLQDGWTTPVRIDCRYFDELPRVEFLKNLTLSSFRLPGTSRLANTCTTEAVVEVLRILKRSYFPYRWNTALDVTTEFSGGGFQDAASRLLSETDMALDAMARAAEYRLERGIFTSTGAGDLRRCVAACERLVLLVGDERSYERRDLAVLYAHLGYFGKALVELDSYRKSAHYKEGCSPQERSQVDELLVKLPTLAEVGLESESVGYGSGLGAHVQPLSMEHPDSVLYTGPRKKLSIHW